MESAPTHYEVLDVPADASAEQVRSAWRRAAKTHHPDAGGNAAIFRMVAGAYSVLSDPALRAEYDRELAGPVVEPPPEPPPAPSRDVYADGRPGRDAQPEPEPEPEPEYAPPPPPPSYLPGVPKAMPCDIERETSALRLWGIFALVVGLRLAALKYFGPHPPVWYHAALFGPVENLIVRAFLFLVVTSAIVVAGLVVAATAYRAPVRHQLTVATAAWLAAFHPLSWSAVFVSAVVAAKLAWVGIRIAVWLPKPMRGRS